MTDFHADMAAMSDRELAERLAEAYAEHRQARDEAIAAGIRVSRYAYELHNREGWGYGRIADLLGISRTRARQMVIEGDPANL